MGRDQIPAEAMAWIERPRSERIERLGRTPSELDELIAGAKEAELAQRPTDTDWAPTEVICHFRDVEDLFLTRYRMMIQMDDPRVPSTSTPADPKGWGLLEDGAKLFDEKRIAEERQYLRNDPRKALDSFRDRRRDTLGFLERLSAEQWRRGAIHPVFGRITFDDFVAIEAWHDDNHVNQLRESLASG
jgi:hypothetical protein